jgi:hypothetical protein
MYFAAVFAVLQGCKAVQVNEQQLEAVMIS